MESPSSIKKYKQLGDNDDNDQENQVYYYFFGNRDINANQSIHIPFDDFSHILHTNSYTIIFWLSLANFNPKDSQEKAILSLAKKGSLLPIYQLYVKQNQLRYKA